MRDAVLHLAPLRVDLRESGTCRCLLGEPSGNPCGNRTGAAKPWHGKAPHSHSTVSLEGTAQGSPLAAHLRAPKLGRLVDGGRQVAVPRDASHLCSRGAYPVGYETAWWLLRISLPAGTGVPRKQATAAGARRSAAKPTA